MSLSRFVNGKLEEKFPILEDFAPGLGARISHEIDRSKCRPSIDGPSLRGRQYLSGLESTYTTPKLLE